MIDGVSVSDLTPAALVGIFVLLLFFGRIVPKPILDREREEKERWRLAYEAERDARGISDAQTRELLEIAKTTQHFIEAVFANSERTPQTEGSTNETTVPT